MLLMAWGQVSGLQQQLAIKQQQVSSLTTQNTELQRDLASLQEERQEIEGRLTTLRTQLAAATDELASLREAEMRTRLLEEENARLERELGEVSQDRQSWEARIKELESKNTELEQSASRLKNRLALLERDYQHLAKQLDQSNQRAELEQPLHISSSGSSSVQAASSPVEGRAASQIPHAIELPPIVVRKDSAGAAMSVRAQVIEVNPREQFLVIDQGADHGIKVGMRFDIARGGTPIAEALVVRVRSGVAACDVAGSSRTGFPQVGDVAVQRHE